MKLEKEINYYIVKEWAELSEAEKEKELEKCNEWLSYTWGNIVSENYENDIADIKDRYAKKGIHFEDIYLETSYMRYWVDKIKNLSVNRNIKIFGEDIEINDVYVKVGEDVETDDIEIYEYYIDDAKLERIKATKKYQNFIEEIRKDLQDMLDEIDKAVKTLNYDEYNIPQEFIEEYMEDGEYSFKITEQEYNELKDKGVA